jgi:hypothetical protein
MSTAVAQDIVPATEQLDLFDPLAEASYYHDISRFGFFSVLYQVPDTNRKHQRSYRLPDMPEVIRLLPKDRDTWISQAEFTKPNRRIVNLARLGLLFVDIDCYNVGVTPEWAYQAIRYLCEENHIPYPSIAIHSGRGLQLKWLLEKPLPRHALPRWNATQAMLVDLFAEIGADANAKDASRVLRLVDTINTKSGATVRVLDFTDGDDGLPKRYDFEELSVYRMDDSVFDKKKQNHPFSEEEKARMVAAREAREAKKAHLELLPGGKNKSSGLRGFSGRQLAWHRVEDIRTLMKLRGGVPAGMSMNTLFWSLNFLLLSGATNPDQVWHEAAELCREFGFGDFKRRDELSTLYLKAKDFTAGRTVILGGKEMPALYTPKNDTLIQLFQITDEEQRQLRTIICGDVAAERHRIREQERRRSAGMVSREAYISSNNKKRATARLLRATGKSIREIAAELCVSKSIVSIWCS